MAKCLCLVKFSNSFIPILDAQGQDRATGHSRVGSVPQAGTDIEWLEGPDALIADLKAGLCPGYVWLEDVVDAKPF